MSDNHWTIFLVFADGTSVRMNMIAEYPDPTGSLEWRSLPYDMSLSTVQSWDYQAAPGVTVGHIYKLMINNGRDKYEMSGGGGGLRLPALGVGTPKRSYAVSHAYSGYPGSWTVLKDLEVKGFLTRNDAGDDWWPKLHYQYSRSGRMSPLDMVYGTFTA